MFINYEVFVDEKSKVSGTYSVFFSFGTEKILSTKMLLNNCRVKKVAFSWEKLKTVLFRE